MAQLEDHWSCSSPERLSHCKLMGFKLIENRPMKSLCMDTIGPRGMAKFDPRGMTCTIYNGDYQTLLYTKYRSSGPFGFREEDFV